MIQSLLEFLVPSILLTLSPGPDIIYVLIVSIRKGFKDGFLLSLGLVSGIIVHVSLVAFGVSAIIKASPHLYLAIKVCGAAYLLYLAYKVYKSPAEIDFKQSSSQIQSKGLYAQGFIMNVLNPKVTLFFLAFFPSFLWDLEHHKIAQFYTLGLVFMLQAILIFGAVAYLCQYLYTYLKNHPHSSIVLKYTQVLVFISIAVFILLDHEY